MCLFCKYTNSVNVYSIRKQVPILIKPINNNTVDKNSPINLGADIFEISIGSGAFCFRISGPP